MAQQSYQDAAIFPGSELELIRQFMHSEGIADQAWTLGSGLDHVRFDVIGSAISWHQFDTIYRNVYRLAQRPGLGIDFGLSLNLSRWGVLAAGLLCANTLGHALAIAYDYRAILRSRFSMSVATSGDVFLIHLEHQKALRFPVDEVFGYEVFLGSLKSQISQLLGRPTRFLTLELPFARPIHHKSYLKVCEQAPVFDAPHACISLPLESIERPLPMKNRVSRTTALTQCRDELARIKRAQAGDIAFVCSAILRQYPVTQMPSLGRVAEQLTISPRTLRRKLLAAGTCFRELCDRHRFQLAEALLSESGASIQELAGQCGFKDEAAFHKAFRRWTGQTPGYYRRMKTRNSVHSLAGSSIKHD